MNFWRSLYGAVRVRVTSADSPGTLRAIQKHGYALDDVVFVDDLTIMFSVSRKDARSLLSLMKQRGEKTELLSGQGIYWTIYRVLRRQVLVFGLAFLMIFSIFLSSRVFFIRVEGNAQVPTRLILVAAAECGIGFGASRREVRSEKMKNALLSTIPELQWAGINTAGCVATISVRERQAGIAAEDIKGVSSIVATRDGVIEELVVTKGSPTCKVGQAVKAGQVLISGYTNCGLSIRAQRAQGEVYAQTDRTIQVVSPNQWQKRGKETSEETKFALIIGKKRINFYQGSGNLNPGCVKIYEEKYLTLPGGFQLPIAIVTERWISCEQSVETETTEDIVVRLPVLAESYLRTQMIAGQILSRQEQILYGDGVCTMIGQYGCLEMIGIERNEEIIAP